MSVYFVLYLVILFSVINESRISKQHDYKKTLLLMFFTSLIVGFRDMIGGYDLYIYGEFFDSFFKNNISYHQLPSITLFEPGYVLYNYLINTITNNRYLFFLTSSVIAYLLFYSSLKKYAPYIYFSFFIFFCKYFFFTFVYVRQVLAVGVAWYSLKYIYDKSLLKFVGVVMIAASLHTSALLFLPLYYIVKVKISSKQIIYIFIVSLILGLTPFIKMIFSVIGNTFQIDKANSYAEGGMSGTNVFYLIEAFLITVSIVKLRDQLYSQKLLICLTNILICYISISLLTLREATANRLTWFFLIGYVGLIPVICKLLQNKISGIKYFVIIYFSLMFFRLLILWDGGDMLPYKTFFQDFNRNGRWEYLEYDHEYNANKFYK